jgi:hypothetical protein
MEDDLKRMEDHLKRMEDNLQKNGRQPKKILMKMT